MGRTPCCDKLGMKKGPWTPEEDNILFSFINQHGHGSWRSLPPKAGLRRCGKSCRLRWINYLRPDIKRGKFSFQEEQTIIHLHAFLGNRWSAIASHLPKRTDNEIKNYWNTHLKKRLTKMGIDPTTHKPMSHALISQPKDLSHMAQWETARLEAESRIVRESKLALSNPNPNYYYHYHYYNKTATAAAAPPPPPPPPPPPARPPCLDILKVWQGMTWTNPRKDHTMVNNNNNGVFTADHGMLMANYTAAAAAPSHDGLTIHESAFLNDDGRKTSREDDQQIKEVIFFEDNKVTTDYWSNILNVVNSPIDLHHCF